MDKEQLYRFFEGESTEDEMREIKAWMESSGENERFLLKERKVFDAILFSGDTQTKEPAKEKAVSGQRRLLLALSKVAAVAIVTLLLSYGYRTYVSGSGDVLTQSITVPPGQRVNLQLPDGTDVCLNARSTLSYPVNFSKKNRILKLDGEAYFEVAPDAACPFVVETKAGKTEVLGTSFNVEAYSFSDEFEVTLMEGKVKVSLHDESVESVMLVPDKKACLKDGVLMVEHVSDYTPYRWREGLICFKRTSFEDIMKEFEKYYGVEVRIRNKEVLSHYYTGKFRHTDGIDYALRVLQLDISFLYNRDDEQQVIYID